MSRILPEGTPLRGGDYMIQSCLGQGSFGITYRALDTTLNRLVALKEFFPGGCRREGKNLTPGGEWVEEELAAYKESFIEEGRSLARLRHPGIVQIYAVFRENGTAYLAMEFAEGQTLRDYMTSQGGRLTVQEALRVTRKTGEALQVVHAAGLLHRDLKPGNIVRCPDGRIVLIDFGAARAFTPDTEMSQTVILTHGYAPLEQYSRQGQRGTYTDVYGLAATFYCLLTGQKPIIATDRVVGFPLSAPRDICVDIPVEISQAVMDGLHLQWDKRPATVEAFLALLPDPDAPAPLRGRTPSSRPLLPDLPTEEGLLPANPAAGQERPGNASPDPPLAVAGSPTAQPRLTTPSFRRAPGLATQSALAAPVLKRMQNLQGHKNGVWTAAWSPNAQRIATAGGDMVVRIWNAAQGQMERALQGHESNIVAVAWSPGGQRLASGSWDCTVRLWDTISGLPQETLRGHLSQVESVAWSPDGRRIASAGWDNMIRLWDAGSGMTERVMQGHTDWIFRVAWSPDNRRLASVSQDKTARIWDAETGKLERAFEGSQHSLISAAWSPDGRRIACGGLNGAIRLWNVETGHLEGTLEGHTASVWSVSWHVNGVWLASGSGDKTARLWNTETGAMLQALPDHTRYVMSVAWSADGKYLATAGRDSVTRLWEIQS